MHFWADDSRGSFQYSEQARVRAEMNPFCGSRIFKRRINYIEKAFAAPYHLKSTEIAVFQNVRKDDLVISQTTIGHLESRKTVIKLSETRFGQITFLEAHSFFLNQS